MRSKIRRESVFNSLSQIDSLSHGLRRASSLKEGAFLGNKPPSGREVGFAKQKPEGVSLGGSPINTNEKKPSVG